MTKLSQVLDARFQQMENGASKRRLIRHFLALICSTGFLTVVPIALYGGLIVWSGDLGGPLNLVIIPVVSAAIGFVISLLIYLPLSLLAENSDIQRWCRIVGFVLSVLAAIVILAWVALGTTSLQNRAYLFVGMVAIYLVSGFFLYVCALAVGTRLWRRP